MSQSKPGRPVLTVCPACKLAYAPEKNPQGCPYCAANPGLARVTREREQEERARQGTIWPLLQGWFAGTRVKLGAVVIAVIIIGLTLWFWTRASETMGDRAGAIREQLIRTQCLRIGVPPGSPELKACVEDIGRACAGIPLAALQDCVFEQAAGRMRGLVFPR
jgi:hypothetical protein